MASKTSLIPSERIDQAILFLRGERVLLDKDLAALYGVPAKTLNRAVTRNLDRFPEDFVLQLTREEFSNLESQFGTSSWGGTLCVRMLETVPRHQLE